jgi:pimeloyl-ACP methyl ester carboxylesterase
MNYRVRKEGNFRYIDEGQGDVLLLLHGLFGALSNWDGVINTFGDRYRVVIPVMPIYEMPIREAGLEGLVKFIEEFLAYKDLDNLTLLGNSLGGHVGLLYTAETPRYGETAGVDGQLRIVRKLDGRFVPETG